MVGAGRGGVVLGPALGLLEVAFGFGGGEVEGLAAHLDGGEIHGVSVGVCPRWRRGRRTRSCCLASRRSLENLVGDGVELERSARLVRRLLSLHDQLAHASW